MLFYAKKGLAGTYIHILSQHYCKYITVLNVHYNTCVHRVFSPRENHTDRLQEMTSDSIPIYTCIEALAIISSPISNVLVQYSLPSFPHESPNKTFHCLIQHTSQDIKHA